MKLVKKYSEVIAGISVALGMIIIACTLAYLTTTDASNDPRVQRKFRLTLMTGEKKEQVFWINKGSDVWIDTHRGSYWLKCNWHSKGGWNTKTLKAGVIDFEEIK